MQLTEYSPGKFDVYVRRLGKVSTGCSAFLLALKVLVGCGGIIAGLYSIAQLLLLLPFLWLPLLWRRIKDHVLDNTAAKWALFGSLAPFAVLLISMIFDTTGKHGCFR